MNFTVEEIENGYLVFYCKNDKVQEICHYCKDAEDLHKFISSLL